MNRSMQTVRFSDLVKHFGPAHLVTLWSDPKADETFMRAVEENQVVTVTLQNAGTRKDFGVVGFDPKPSATYIVFSKPLSVAKGTKVVGLKYELIEEARVKDPVPRSELQPKVRPHATRPVKVHLDETGSDRRIVPFPAAPKPLRRFKVTIGVTARSRIEKEVEAANAKEASAKALQDAQKQPVDATNAVITRRVINAKKVT